MPGLFLYGKGQPASHIPSTMAKSTSTNSEAVAPLLIPLMRIR
jgi:hypothetical protein